MSRFRPFGLTVQAAVDLALNGGGSPSFVVHKFGKNTSIVSGDCIMEPGGAYPHLAYEGTPLAMRVKALGNVADTLAGTGAQRVTIQGLDSDFRIASETVDLAGASASAVTTALFARVMRVFVESVGSGHVNAGDIVIEDSGGANDFATILAGEGQSQLGHVTVPLGYRGYLTHIHLDTDISSGTGFLEIRGFQRTYAIPHKGKRLFFQALALSKQSGLVERHFANPIEFGPKTDVWFEGVPSAGAPAGSVQFTMLFEPITTPR